MAGLVVRARPQPGERVVVHGGAGAVSSFATYGRVESPESFTRSQRPPHCSYILRDEVQTARKPTQDCRWKCMAASAATSRPSSQSCRGEQLKRAPKSLQMRFEPHKRYD